MFPYVVSKLANSQALIACTGLSLRLVSQNEKYSIFQYVEGQLCISDLHTHLLELGYDRIFEGCYVFSNGEMDERFQAVCSLFSIIGGDNYLTSVNRAINISCYDQLYAEASKYMDLQSIDVLDFGSGPGLISESKLHNPSTRITCFDAVECNLTAARARNLSTINLDQFLQLQPSSIDLIVSAYVLHYESVTRSGLHQAFATLRKGGIWAANFHKAKGIDWFISEVTKHGGFELKKIESSHGPLLLIKKDP